MDTHLPQRPIPARFAYPERHVSAREDRIGNARSSRQAGLHRAYVALLWCRGDKPRLERIRDFIFAQSMRTYAGIFSDELLRLGCAPSTGCFSSDCVRGYACQAERFQHVHCARCNDAIGANAPGDYDVARCVTCTDSLLCHSCALIETRCPHCGAHDVRTAAVAA